MVEEHRDTDGNQTSHDVCYPSSFGGVNHPKTAGIIVRPILV